MHARTVYTFAVVNPGLGLVLHLVLFVGGHAVQDLGQIAGSAFTAVEVGGQVGAVIGVYLIRYTVDGVLMAEVYGIAVLVRGVRVHGVRQIVNAVVHRHGQHVHGDAGDARAHAGHNRFHLPLGLGLDGQGVLRVQLAVLDDGAGSAVKGIHFHADADAGHGSESAFAGGVVRFYGVGGFYVDIVRRQLAIVNAGGHPVVDLVHVDAAGDAETELAGRYAHGNQGGLHLGGVVRFNGKIGCPGIRAAVGSFPGIGTAVGTGSLDVAVLHSGSSGGFFSHHAHAHIQGSCYRSRG